MSDTMCAKTTETSRCRRCGSEFDWLSDGTKIHAGKKYFESDSLLCLERQLNAANQRIKQLEAVVNDPEVLWSNWLRGTVKLPSGIGDVRQYQARINRLEDCAETAWGVIANVDDGGWHKQRPDWREAARRWFSEQYTPAQELSELKAKEAKP